MSHVEPNHNEKQQITNGDAWRSYCEGQEVGFKKAEDVFERMKLIQETVDCIRNTFNLDMESDKLVRNCMALVQNAIDGEYHDMEEVDVSELERPEGKWIPVSERTPDDLEPVNITWINHEPEPYYKDIKDKPFTATGVYFNGQWYWWSTLCTDTLAEYSFSYDDMMDTAIEVIAWRPLPEPYKEGEEK